ncbi:MAG: tripartite tricarboxylate transporter substrate-binding protein, partial [Burkholderiales bacterium]
MCVKKWCAASFYALALLLIAAGGASAQGYPVKPVRMVVAFAAGGTTDILARVFSQKLSASTGQQFIVDNRVGAGGTIGTDVVAKAARDGYT